MKMIRDQWTRLNDKELLAQCEVDTYRASGPGGQKRNKTSSAVRVRHPASGLIVIAEESRSQHENRVRALKRLRQAFYLKIREEIAAENLRVEFLSQLDDYKEARDAYGRLNIGRKDARFLPAIGVTLDVLCATSARVSEAAAALGVSTGNLIDFLQADPKVWEQANILRTRFGQKALRAS
jgi:hypothetical protein